ncbi:MAG: hypothetical protein FWD15_01905 [Alphaproteobacteria bacterium]|nr:hypothetical protein [Alphaproteobacteria bacterium]
MKKILDIFGQDFVLNKFQKLAIGASALLEGSDGSKYVITRNLVGLMTMYETNDKTTLKPTGVYMQIVMYYDDKMERKVWLLSETRYDENGGRDRSIVRNDRRGNIKFSISVPNENGICNVYEFDGDNSTAIGAIKSNGSWVNTLKKIPDEIKHFVFQNIRKR